MAKSNNDGCGALYQLVAIITFFHNYGTIGHQLAQDPETTAAAAMWWFFCWGPISSMCWGIIWPFYWLGQVL